MSDFRLQQTRLLEVELDNEKVLALAGSMVAYTGKIKFEKSLLGGEGFFGAIKRSLANESFELMTVNGTGTVYFAHQAREISILPLQGEKMFIESRSILALTPNLKTNVTFAGLRGATSGQGLFTTTIEGIGEVAVLSDGEILAFEINPNLPLFVDPDAFIGYQGNLRQDFVYDVNWKTTIGQSSGESYQLKFTGSGIVYIQPSERK